MQSNICRVSALVLLFCLILSPAVATAGLMESIPIQEPAKEFGGAAIREQIQAVGSNIVAIVRVAFICIAVVFLICGALALLAGGGDPDKVAWGKKMFVGFLLSAFCIYSAETIVGALLGWFNL